MLNHQRAQRGRAATDVIGRWPLVAGISGRTSCGDAARTQWYWVSGSITGAIVWECGTSASAEGGAQSRKTLPHSEALCQAATRRVDRE